MPMIALVMMICEHQQFYIFTKKVQQYSAQCTITVGLFIFLNILSIIYSTPNALNTASSAL